MASSALATAFVNIVPGTAQMEAYLKGGLQNQMGTAGTDAGAALAKNAGQGFSSKIGAYIKPALATMAASFAAVGVANFLKDSITAASDFNEQGAAVGEVFGKAADDIQKFAASGAKSLGQSKTQVLEASKTFGVYGKAAGLAGEDNAAFSKELVTLATDLASFNNTSVDEAILALGSGLRGESEPLKRFGVLLNDFDLRQQAVKMGLIETTKQALTPQMKVLASYALIMDQTAVQQGDFGRTSEGLANQQRILEAQTKDLSITFGTALLPIVNSIVTFMNNNMVPAFDAIFGFISNNIPTIATFAGVLGGLLIVFNAATIATKAWAVAQGILNFIMALNPFTLIAIAIAGLIAAIVFIATKTTFFQDTWAAMTKFIGEAWNNTVKAITTAGAAVIKWFIDLPATIRKGLGDVGTWLLDAGKNIIDGLLKGITNAAKGIGDFFGNIGKTAMNGFKKVLGIASPSKVFIQFGKNIMQGLKKGLTDDVASMKATMEKVGNFIADALADKKISKKTAAAASKLVKDYTAKIEPLAKAHEEVLKKLDAAEDKLKDRITERLNYIESITKKFGSGLAVQDKMTAKDAVAQLKDRIAKTKELAKVMAQLQTLGLSGDLYQQVLDSGNLEFAKSIAEGGAATVAELNTLAAEANSTAMQLGTQAGDILYNQGIQAAQGIVDGLKSEEASLVAQMSVLADEFSSQLSSVIEADTTEALAAAAKKTTTATKKTAAKATPTKVSSAKASAAFKSVKKKAATGGLFNRPTRTLIAEAGPELVTPLKDFERMVSSATGGGNITYIAAPNQSLDAEQQLFMAIKRAKAVGAW
jgi:hypothetical protein